MEAQSDRLGTLRSEIDSALSLAVFCEGFTGLPRQRRLPNILRCTDHKADRNAALPHPPHSPIAALPKLSTRAGDLTGDGKRP